MPIFSSKIHKGQGRVVQLQTDGRSMSGLQSRRIFLVAEKPRVRKWYCSLLSGRDHSGLLACPGVQC